MFDPGAQPLTLELARFAAAMQELRNACEEFTSLTARYAASVMRRER